MYALFHTYELSKWLYLTKQVPAIQNIDTIKAISTALHEKDCYVCIALLVWKIIYIMKCHYKGRIEKAQQTPLIR